MIQITDLLTGENFDLPKDFKISIEETNPLLSEQGSVSLPINLPYTRRNVRLTGFLHRIDRAKKQVAKRDVVISADIFIKKGTLVITSAQKDAALTGVVMLGESQLYSKMKDVTLQQIFANEIRDPFLGSIQQKIVRWLYYLEQIMVDNSDNELTIFPVMIKNGNLIFDTGGYYSENTFDYLNHVAVASDFWNKQIFDIDGRTGGYKLSAQQQQTRTIDAVSITYPVGYRVTPFLKLMYVLPKIFEYFGFKLHIDTFFEKKFSQVAILNNNLDSLMFGKVYYAQLLPTVSANEYLKALTNKYGFEFVLEQSGVDVSMVFWKDILSATDKTDITSNLSAEPIIAFESPKMLKLSRNYPELQLQQRLKSYDEFKKEYPEILSKYETDAKVYWDSTFLTVMEWTEAPGDSGYSNVGNYSFDFYDAKNNFESIEKKTEEVFVEMVPGDMASIDGYGVSINTHAFAVTPYIEEVRSMNTYLKIGDSVKENKEQKCPIMHCFRVGRYYVGTINTMFGDSRLFFGSTYATVNGLPVEYDIDLNYFGSSGLYEVFWKPFDAMIQHSFHSISCKLCMSGVEIINLLKFRLVLLRSQPLLPESVKYEISNESIKIIRVKFRTIKSYE